MTNLYEFLRFIRDEYDTGDVNLSPEYLKWLDDYLQAPDVLINFKARRVGGTDEEPVMAQDFQIAGEGLEVFYLITEAMVNNYRFAKIIQSAVGFYRDHIPKCPICAPKHFGSKEPPKDWQFSHSKPEQDGK